jgi:hypothetical protein
MCQSEAKMNRLQQRLFTQADVNIFAVLDGAVIPDLLAQLQQYQPESCCLYRGRLEPDLAAAAPYLIRLEQGSALLDWIDGGWGKHWGIFAAAKANLRTMRQHFRRLLTVELPEGKVVYFRFYDPRVLRVFLPTCHEEERRLMFGPVLWYGMEGEGEPPSWLPFASREV